MKTKFLLFTLSLFVFVSCFDTDKKEEEVLPESKACFTASAETKGEVSFTNCSSDATVYGWSFGDGQVSTDQSPTHTYSVNGTYTVTLVASNTTSADSVTSTVEITSIGEVLPSVPCQMMSFGNEDEYFMLTYDDNGLINSISEYEKEDNDFDGTYTVQRDDNSRVLSMTQIDDDEELEVYTFTYDDTNSTITISESDSEYKTKYIFEGPLEDMKLIERIEAIGTEYEYSIKYVWENGNIIKEEEKSGTQVWESTYEYYDTKNTLKETLRGSFMPFIDTELLSDHNLKKRTSPSGHINSYTYTYHEDGRVDTQTVEETRTDTEPTYSGTYTYEYSGCE